MLRMNELTPVPLVSMSIMMLRGRVTDTCSRRHHLLAETMPAAGRPLPRSTGWRPARSNPSESRQHLQLFVATPRAFIDERHAAREVGAPPLEPMAPYPAQELPHAQNGMSSSKSGFSAGSGFLA